MNELYAADPAVCCHASDLKLLLASFGPFAGRYLANYPTDWASQVEQRFASCGEVEAARVQTLLRRAKENLTLVTRSNLPWDAQKAWLPNASPMLSGASAVFDGLIALETRPPAVQQLHELELPPTSEERVAGIAAEYARISKIMLVLSPEIALIDPYLNPLKSKYSVVLASLFEIAAKGKCQKVSLWARANEVLGNSNAKAVKAELHAALQQFLRKANFKPGREVELVLVDDESRKSKMHGRYLLSIKGGVRLDQGFQNLPAGRQVDVGPIGKPIHNQLLDIFFEGKHDMRVVDRMSIKL